MPSDLFLKGMNTVHRTVLRISGGRLGWETANMTVVELTTTGRRSGQPHTVLLTSPVRVGEAIVVVASRGGADHHPAWFLNLRDDPAVQVKVGGKPAAPFRARIATSDERDRMWPIVTAKYKGYAGYQEKTDREIPLVILDPA